MEALFAEVSEQTKEKKHISSNEFASGWVENRELFTCASWAKWNVARDLDISVLLDVQEGVKWWDGEISVSEGKEIWDRVLPAWSSWITAIVALLYVFHA